MIKIVPAVLASTKEEYTKRLNVIRQLTDRFQLDVIDGEFADNITVDVSQITRPTDIKMDLHLMVAEPMKWVDKTLHLHPYTVIVQFEGSKDIEPVLARLKKATVKVGLALNPETPVSKLKPFIDMLDHVLIMGYPAGFSGQKFQPEVLDKIPQVRDLKSNVEIGLDGGVNEKTMKKICSSDLDLINVNSYLFETEDVLSRYSTILAECL